MTLYMVLFLMGFMLAIGLLAYSSMQVAELSKHAEALGNTLKDRYSKSIKEFVEEKREVEPGESAEPEVPPSIPEIKSIPEAKP
jgi:hypothetical protein